MLMLPAIPLMTLSETMLQLPCELMLILPSESEIILGIRLGVEHY